MSKRVPLFILAVVPVQRFAITSANAALTIRVVDYASIPPRVIRPAIADAQAVFRRAGVKTKWLSRPNAPWSPSFQALNKSVTSAECGIAISAFEKDYHGMACFSLLLPPSPAKGEGTDEEHDDDCDDGAGCHASAS